LKKAFLRVLVTGDIDRVDVGCVEVGNKVIADWIVEEGSSVGARVFN